MQSAMRHHSLATSSIVSIERSKKIDHFISFYKNGRHKEAMRVLHDMDDDGIRPCGHTWMSLLRACINLKALAEAKHVHACILRAGLTPDIFLQTTLIVLCTKNGNIHDAERIFSQMHKRDVVSWNAMIAGHARLSDPGRALECLWKMEQDGILPDDATFLSIFKACGRLGVLNEGTGMHHSMFEFGIMENLQIRNTLIDMYAKCGSMEDACTMFENSPSLSAVTWTAIITGHALHGNVEEALRLLWEMQQKGMNPDDVTFLGVLNACAGAGDLEHGKQVHACILQSGVATVALGNALVNMYAKCGCMDKAHEVLYNQGGGDVIAWTAIIVGYSRLGCVVEAFKTYVQMQREGVKPNEVTYLSLLTVCLDLGALEEGKQIHADLVQSGIKQDFFLEGMLVGMYVKCGYLEKAQALFDQMRERDLVTWSTLIAGYARWKHIEKAFEVLQRMEHEGYLLDDHDLVSSIQLCASMASLERGRKIHSLIISRGLHPNIYIASALIDMYVKCGEIKCAKEVLDSSQKRDVVLWTALITGYAQHGQYNEALQVVGQMDSEGMILNDVSFLGILSACSHAGLIEEGCWQFKFMTEERGIMPRVEHYTCVVDLLSRAGLLGEAERVILEMNCRAEAGVWLALLGGCRSFCHVELAERAAAHVLKLEPDNTSAALLMASANAMGT